MALAIIANKEIEIADHKMNFPFLAWRSLSESKFSFGITFSFSSNRIELISSISVKAPRLDERVAMRYSLDS